MKPRLDVKLGLYRSAKEECKVDYDWILIVLIKTGGGYSYGEGAREHVKKKKKRTKSTQRDKLKLFKSCRPRRDSVRSWFPTVWGSRRTRTGRASPRLWSSMCRVPPRWASLSLLLHQHLCARECAASRERAGGCCAPPTCPGPEGSAPPAGERRRRSKYRSRGILYFSICNRSERCTNNLSLTSDGLYRSWTASQGLYAPVAWYKILLLSLSRQFWGTCKKRWKIDSDSPTPACNDAL